VTKKAPAKKTTARKPTAEVTAKPVETIERGQVVLWSKADLLDPEDAGDEEHWWPIPEGIWREVNSVSADTNRYGEPVLVVEFASSSHSGDDFDERTYRPGTVLQTKPPTYRTHKVGSTLKVGDHIKIGDYEWIVHDDWLEER
jgi:hypothetical protein